MTVDRIQIHVRIYEWLGSAFRVADDRQSSRDAQQCTESEWFQTGRREEQEIAIARISSDGLQILPSEIMDGLVSVRELHDLFLVGPFSEDEELEGEFFCVFPELQNHPDDRIKSFFLF